jgi:hypothetical protein
VTNGGFEQGNTAGWTISPGVGGNGANFFSNSGDSNTGFYSGIVFYSINFAASQQLQFQAILAVTGTTALPPVGYRLSAWYKMYIGTPGTFACSLRLSLGNDAVVGTGAIILGTTGAWTQLEAVVPPQDDSSMSMTFLCQGSGSGIVSFELDDFTLYPIY